MAETETDGVSCAHCLPQSERSLLCPHAVYIVVTEEEVNRDKRDARGVRGGRAREKGKVGGGEGNSLVKSLSGVMRRSWREGQEEIRRDLEWERKRRRGREVLL